MTMTARSGVTGVGKAWEAGKTNAGDLVVMIPAAKLTGEKGIGTYQKQGNVMAGSPAWAAQTANGLKGTQILLLGIMMQALGAIAGERTVLGMRAIQIRSI
jgi:hypothetical protein